METKMWWEDNDKAKEFLEFYKNSKGEKNIVIFLGAGITAGIFPTWTSLLQDMLKELKKKDVLSNNKIQQIENAINEGVILEAASEIKRGLSDKEFNKYIWQQFKCPAKYSSNLKRRVGNLKNLITNPNSPIWSAITTNFDNITSEVAPYPGSLFNSNNHLGPINDYINSKSSFLWHLHGEVKDYENIIITKEDYNKILEESLFVKNLEDLLSNNTILYLGYSIQDHDVKFVLDKIQGYLINSYKGYILLPKPTQEETEKFDAKITEFNYKNINVITYDPENNHKAFDEFIEELVRIIPSQDIDPFETYLRNVQKKDIIHSLGYQQALNVQYNDYKNVFFSEIRTGIGQRSAKKISKRLLYEEIENSIINNNERIIVVGESGIGKSTLCLVLRKKLIELGSSKKIIPLIVLLRSKQLYVKDQKEIDKYTLLDYEEHHLSEITKFKEDPSIKFVLILDGLNEIDDVSRKIIIPAVNEFSKKFNDIAVIFTSRSVGLSEELCELIDNLKIYEIQRWTENQLLEYFKNNSVGSIESAIRNLSPEMQNALRLPLFAWLFLQTIQSSFSVSLNSISDIFNYFLQKHINPDKEEKLKSGGIKTDYPIDVNVRLKILYELAHIMTKQKRLAITCDKIKEVIPKTKKKNFRDFALHLINSGILRSVDSAIIDQHIHENSLRSIKIMFLHQAFQEYLTAKYLSNRKDWKNLIPKDLSGDSFWRDVPHYMLSLIDRKKPDSIEKSNKLVRAFMDIEDYWTAARLANELNVAERDRIKLEICERLIENLSIADAYANATNAFREFGELGRQQLLRLLVDSDSIEEIIAWPELHLHKKKIQNHIKSKYGPEEERVEKEWRKLGRAVTIIGELQEQKFIEELLPHLEKIQSTHLKYHFMESFLLILQTAEDNKIKKNLLGKINCKLQELGWQYDSDRIIGAYTTLFISWNDPKQSKTKSKKEAASKLICFLENKYKKVDKDKYYNDEFWQRAHGFLALAEVASFQDCIGIIKKAIQIECDQAKTSYVNVRFKGYMAVLPAIMTSILRMQQSLGLNFDEIKEVIDVLLPQERFGMSAWALNRLETLLLNTCFEGQLSWLEGWTYRLEQSKLDRTTQIIQNIIHSLQT